MNQEIRSYRCWWFLTGLLLIALHVGIVFISFQLGYDSDNAISPIPVFVALFMAAAAIHLISLTRLHRTRVKKPLVAWVIMVGVVLRVSVLFSEPILEDDFYRYLWDGGVVAHGYGPYVIVPEQVMEGGDHVPEALRELGRDAGTVLQRVNHPHLATCYPPVAQALFAAAHLAGPWRLTAWRLLLFIFDTATLALLFAFLRLLGKSPLYVVVYWWCPLVVKEGFNAAHMDIALLPLVLGALWLSLRSRSAGGHVAAAVVLGLAAGVKLWPVILAPLLFRPLLRRPRMLVCAVTAFGGTLLLILLAMLPAYTLGDASGLVAYGQGWEMNDALFMSILWGIRLFPWLAEQGPLLARAIVASLLGAVILVAVWREQQAPEAWCRRALWIVAALFLLSPTQFPWYYLWVTPFLVFTPRPSLLLLTALLPLYYLRFRFNAFDRAAVFDYGIVWLEFIPVWTLLLMEGLVSFKHRHEARQKEPLCEKRIP